MQTQEGTSHFKWFLLEDAVELDVHVEFDEYGEGHVVEILMDGELDVTEEVLSWGLHDKLVGSDRCQDAFEPFTSDYNEDGEE